MESTDRFRKRKYRNGVTERLIKCLEGLIDEYGLVDISVGAERYLGVSRDRLLSAAHMICEKPHRHFYRFRRDGKWIAVLSCYGLRSTRVVLDKRFNYILGGNV